MPIYKNKDYIKLMRPLPQYTARDVYNIPFIERQDIDLNGLNSEKWLISMKNTKTTDSHADKKIVHSFCYDIDLNRAYNDMLKYLCRVAKYYAVSSFDFSMHEGMDIKQILSATYENRWSGAFMQAHGKNVIATVGWTTEEYDNICFAGLRNGSVFMISSLGVNNKLCMDAFLRGYYKLRQRFPDSKIICVGNLVKGMDLDVMYVPYKQSFGNWEQYPGYWQSQLINPDGTIYFGGEA